MRRAAMFMILTSCVAEEDLPPVAEHEQELLGDLVYDADCTSDMREFLDKSMRFGRAAAAGRAFAQCVDSALRTGTAGFGPYLECTDDPFEGQPIATQVARVLEVTHSPNDVSLHCTGATGANARASIGDYGHALDEELRFSSWLASVVGQLDDPLCAPGESPAKDGCRFAAYPWPYRQAAGLIWHEVMHTHGYTHGADDQANAKMSCGYPGVPDSEWHFQVNTMPYIIGNCLDEVIARSGDHCAIESCGDRAVGLITEFDGTTCACHEDPGPPGLGVVSNATGSLQLADKLYDGERLGSWSFDTAHVVEGTGDFYGDRHEDLVVRSSWGLGVVGRDYLGIMRSHALAAWGTTIGAWTIASSQTIVGTGDLNGDGRTDLVLRGSNGIGVLTVSWNGFQTLARTYHGAWYGNWNHGSGDAVAAIGDFDGDGRDELLLRSAWGIGILELYGSSWRSINMAQHGTTLGGWDLASTDSVRGVGDFDGDGAEDIVLRSSWGYGVIGRDAYGWLRSNTLAAFGAWQGSWNLQATNALRGIGDVSGDGRADLLFTSGWGLGVLTRSSSGGLTNLAMHAFGSRLGDWSLAAGHTFPLLADLNGDGREEILVRSSWGIGVLRYGYGALTSLTLHAFGGLAGSWALDPTDVVEGAADFTGDGKADLLLRRR